MIDDLYPLHFVSLYWNIKAIKTFQTVNSLKTKDITFNSPKGGGAGGAGGAGGILEVFFDSDFEAGTHVFLITTDESMQKENMINIKHLY